MNIWDIFMYIAYILLGVAIIAAIVFPLVQMVKQPKKARTSIIILSTLLGIFLLSVAISSNELYDKQPWISNLISKEIGGGLIMMYALLAIAIVIGLYFEIRELLR